MLTVSVVLTGIALVLVSVMILLYPVSSLRGTSVTRHKFFKGLRMFASFGLLPLFAIIAVYNLYELITEDFITIQNSRGRFLNLVFVLINVLLVIRLIIKPASQGISLFRRHNRDNTKYNKAISKTRLGFVLVLFVCIAMLFFGT